MRISNHANARPLDFAETSLAETAIATTTRSGAFNPRFPRGAYFGLIAPTGPLNHTNLHPSLAFRPQKGRFVSARWLFYWRTQRDDGLSRAG